MNKATKVIISIVAVFVVLMILVQWLVLLQMQEDMYQES